MTDIKARTADYGLGPYTYPRGWFVVAESSELDEGAMALRYFGREYAMYRGESGRVVILDAFCKHMGTHLARSTSAHIVTSAQQIEGDSIRCPYHAWKYGADGQLEEIPYQPGVCPASAALRSHPVRELMGCILMWFDPEEGEPDFEPPYLPAWDRPDAIHWQLDHLGEVPVHQVEILDNMTDVHHLGPTHGSPCEYFENEFRDTLVIQRQGGFLAPYQAHLDTVTWYTGPGILLSKQTFNGVEMYELIANTPVADGLTRAWHAVLSFAQGNPASAADIDNARQAQAGALAAFSADFEVWKHKAPAIKVMQTRNDGHFNIQRKWVSQFYMPAAEARKVQEEINGVLPVAEFPQPSRAGRDAGFEDDCFQLMGD
ncbi:MAG: (2Fe-2S)-binding protein [Halioglobus sp.]|nr:(2Fe-2S)-binding protein [Halioglobus sp.]|tara:strand:- start:3834 stop:4952 length:1119 start_codon:yes stop_codon:yes gene_type:complete